MSKRNLIRIKSYEGNICPFLLQSTRLIQYDSTNRRYRTKKRTKQWPFLKVIASLLLLRISEPEIQQFCLLTYPPSVKCASSLKKIFFEKLPSTAFCWSTHFTYLRGCEWSAGFSCYVSRTVYGCRCRSKCKIRHNVP